MLLLYTVNYSVRVIVELFSGLYIYIATQLCGWCYTPLHPQLALNYCWYDRKWCVWTGSVSSSDWPALTVTALTNCSLQLLLPTTRARLVFLMSLSTVFYWCTHTYTYTTHTHTHRDTCMCVETYIDPHPTESTHTEEDGNVSECQLILFYFIYLGNHKHTLHKQHLPQHPTHYYNY